FIGTLNRLAGQWRDGALETTGGAIVTPHAADEWFFRPEDAQLADPAHAPLRGAVGACAFLGERTRLTIEHAAPDALVIDVPGRIALAGDGTLWLLTDTLGGPAHLVHVRADGRKLDDAPAL
ncbi:TOBE domain-containing protein, partial [Enterobacter sp. DRP3]|nr:TOBE domain-containing protein [Enterobacter sp. DRP3]